MLREVHEVIVAGLRESHIENADVESFIIAEMKAWISSEM